MRKLFLTSLFFAGCNMVYGQRAASLTKKITSIPGTYKHFLPCNNCTGIETTLTLDCDTSNCYSGSYELREESVNSINGDKENESTGKWLISDTMASSHDTTIIISLTEMNSEEHAKYYFMLINGNFEELNKKKHTVDPPFDLLLIKLDPSAILDLR